MLPCLAREGLIITITVILAIFCISTITGRTLFYLLLSAVIILLLCVVAIYWVHQQKRQLRESQISHPLSKEDLYVYGIRFNPLPSPYNTDQMHQSNVTRSNGGLGPGRINIY